MTKGIIGWAQGLAGAGEGERGANGEAAGISNVSNKRIQAFQQVSGGLWPLSEVLLDGLKGLQRLVKGEEEVTGKLRGGGWGGVGKAILRFINQEQMGFTGGLWYGGLWPLPEMVSGLKGLQGLVKGAEKVKVQGGGGGGGVWRNLEFLHQDNTGGLGYGGLWPLPEAIFSLGGLKGLQGLVKGEEEVTGKLQGGVEASSATASGERILGL